MPKTKIVICPYCGQAQAQAERCRSCGGLFEPLSRQATHNAMGPWFLRDPGKPFHPGCSYETMVRMIDRGQITKNSIIRGPTTKQFWTVARRVPGMAHLLGYCHNCDASVDPVDHGCHVCGVPFGAYLDRNYLGLPDVRPLPWEADTEGPSPQDRVAPLSAARGGISRFASDEELLAAHSVDRLRPSAAAEVHGDDESPPQDAGSSVFDDYASSAVSRALRRKLASQRKTIQVMAFLLVAVCLASVGVNLWGIAKLRQAGPDRAAAVEPADAVLAIPAERHAPAPPTLPPPVAGDGAGTADADEPQVQSEQEPAADVPGDAYAAVLKLVEAAATEDRTLDERIGDYEKVVQQLEQIRGQLPAGDLPPGLKETLAAADRELERLRLERDFFGSE